MTDVGDHSLITQDPFSRCGRSDISLLPLVFLSMEEPVDESSLLIFTSFDAIGFFG
jgi:hypothetical protein